MRERLIDPNGRDPNEFLENDPMGDALEAELGGGGPINPDDAATPAAGRWSKKLHNRPTWLEGLGGDAEARVKSIYDDEAGDHEAALSGIVDDHFRSSGGRRAEDDATNLRAAFGGGQSAAVPTTPVGASAGGNDAVRQATNPNLDRYLEQMIAGQRAAESRAQAEAADKAAWRTQVRGNIMSQYDKAAAPVDPNDPMIRSMVRTRNAGNQRAMGQQREALAARGSAEGVGTGAFDSAVQQSYENLGRADADFESGLMYDETDKRRSMISNLLSQGAGILNADEDRLLRDKFGTIDADLSRLGLKSGAYGTGRSQDLTERGLDNEGARIDNQNNQFYDDFGMRAANQEELIDRLIMAELMGGA